MPVYDYKCKEHGIFHDLATMDDSQKPANCPTCLLPSARIIMIPPSILNKQSASYKANERNEKNQYEPSFTSKDSREFTQDDPCACHHSKAKNSSLIYTAEGNKMFPSMRPWMISH